MIVEAIAPTNQLAGTVALPPASATPVGGFGDWFESGMQTVNADLLRSERDVQQLASGNGVNLHQVMIHMEEAKLSFQLLAQVRNRMLEAYQEVMRMQV